MPTSDDNFFHPVTLAADTADMQGGAMSRISDALTKGVGAAAVSGTLSIWNTVGDYFGADQVDVAKKLHEVDAQWGDYYTENQNAIDLVGFVGTAWVPGKLGVGALQLARAGTATTTVGRALSLAGSRRDQYLQAALQETAASGGAIKGIVTANRARHLAWSVADEALTATAAEVAIVGLMHDSPIFTDDSKSDMVFNMVLGGGVGGVLGGALSSIGAKGILKSAQDTIEKQKRLFDAPDLMTDAGLKKGTEIMAATEEVLKMSDRYAAAGLDSLPFSYRVDGKVTELPGGLGVGKALKATFDRATRTAEQKLQLKFNELAGGDAALGQAYHGMIQEGISAAKVAGMSTDEISSRVAGYMTNLTSVNRIDLDRLAVESRKFYVSVEPTGLDDMFTKTRMGAKSQKSAYVMEEGISAADLKVVKWADVGHDSLKAAWRSGVDADVIILPGGKAAINPKSASIKRLAEKPDTVRQFVDLRTGTLADETVVHFADTLGKGEIKAAAAGIEGGKRFYRQGSIAVTDISKPAVEGSARFAWASQLDAAGLARAAGGSIDTKDLPMLSRFAELYKTDPLRLGNIKLFDNGLEMDAEDVLDLGMFLREKKMEVIAMQLAKHGNYDLRHIAAHTNTSVDFLEDAIRRNFVPPRTGDELIPDLPTADALLPKTAQLEWDFKGFMKFTDPVEAYKFQMGPNFQATRELAMQEQLLVRQNTWDNAFHAVLGEDASLFLDTNRLSQELGDRTLAQTASQAGAGASLFGAANANYAKNATMAVESMGRATSLVSMRRGEAAVGAVQSQIHAIKANPAAGVELSTLMNTLRAAPTRYSVDPDDATRLISREVKEVAAKEKVDFDTALRMVEMQAQTSGKTIKVKHAIKVENPEVVDLMQQFQRVNANSYDQLTTLYNAAGLTRKVGDPTELYVPPVDTARYKHHAIVRTKEKLGVATDTAMLTARTDAELKALIEQVDPGKYDVHLKGDTSAYFKARGEYDYAMSIHEARANSELGRTGALADFFPKLNPTEAVEDLIRHLYKQEEKVVRTAVQIKNRQFFSELDFLSENYRRSAESTFAAQGSRAAKKIEDPFGDYIKTALNVSKQQEFPLLDSLNEFVDKLGLRIGQALEDVWGKGARGEDIKLPDGTMMKPWAYADKLSKEAGLGMPYSEASDVVQAYMLGAQGTARNVIREGFQKANMLLSNFTLRLDFANSLVNMLSTPIMLGTEWSSIKKMVGDNVELGKMLNELASVQVPGQTYRMPSFTKTIGNGIHNFFGPESAALVERYKKIGAIKDVLTQYKATLDDLTLDNAMRPLQWVDKVNKGVDRMAKYTGNNFSEELTRFLSADMMRQLTDPLVKAGKMNTQLQDTFIASFVNRTQGNYVTSQRPIVFQGTTGAAVSLFQTYAFNVLQQLHRHTEAGDKRTLAVFAGLQSLVFGFNGLPFFDAVNTHLIGSMLANNPDHTDAYRVLPAFNKELGDWMLYGTASAFPLFSGSAPALYTRGDINPRHITLISVNPLDVPAVSASLRLVDTIKNFGKGVMQGADVSEAMLQGLEHHGINRPLAGFAQLLAGKSTTSQGSLISAANDLQTTSWLGSLAERTYEWGGVSRLMGARPMNEAVALNQMYRNKSYDALDKARVANLGRTVKSVLYDNEAPTQEQMDDFMSSYVKAGGRIENFSQFMQRSMKDASVSVVNQTAQKLNTSSGRALQMLMGGELPDYSNAPAMPSLTDDFEQE